MQRGRPTGRGLGSIVATLKWPRNGETFSDDTPVAGVARRRGVRIIVALVRRFLEACARADPEEFAGYFAEDAVGWNAPWRAVVGRDAIRDTLRRGTERVTALSWEVRHIVADGDVVLTERVDHFLVGETRISVPCMGAFELRDGTIAAWRDYWDLAQFERQLPQA